MCAVPVTNQVARRGPSFAIAKPALESACTWHDSSNCGLPSVTRMRPQYEMRCFWFVAPTRHCCAPILVGALPVVCITFGGAWHDVARVA